VRDEAMQKEEPRLLPPSSPVRKNSQYVVYLNCRANGNFAPHSKDHPAMVFSSGEVMYIPQVRYVAHCEMNIRRFPFDKHICYLIFGSWSYDANQVSLRFFGKTEVYRLIVRCKKEKSEKESRY
jgi:hypothetical protein